MESFLELRGASDVTRNLLLNSRNRTNELITKFLNEGRDLETAFNYNYEEIWDILQMKLKPTDRKFVRARNLEQYYKGYRDFGCTLIEVRGLKLRRFQFKSIKENQNYVCVLEREGCHSDADCNKGLGFQTFCYGPTCVEHLPPHHGSKAENAGIRTAQRGKRSEGINQSCYYSIITGQAKCNLVWSEDKIIWDGSPTFPIISGAENFAPHKLMFLFGVYLTVNDLIHLQSWLLAHIF